MPSLSYQLYSSREWPLIETFALLQRLGVTEVEGFGPLYDNPAETKAALVAHGLTMPTGHFALDMLETDPEGTIAIAKTIGVEAVIVPFVMPDERPTDAAGWAAFGARLAKAGKPVVDAGLDFGWHNHAFEFEPCDDGSMPMEHILAGADYIGVELDLAWVAVAGQDVIKWINHYGPRMISAHIKDIAPEGQNADEDGWADVGTGTMDWAAIHAALQNVGCERYILEHDKPSDHVRFAETSVAAVRAF